MNYYNTFIQVAPDCPAKVAVIPEAKGEKKSISVIEYEHLSSKPYYYTQEELQFSVHAIHKAIPASELGARYKSLWAGFFSKPRACLRASLLPKKFGWGIHFDKKGKIAIYPVESRKYLQYTVNKTLKQLFAMRSQRQ